MSEQPTKKQSQTFIEKKPKKDWQYRLRQLKTKRGIIFIIVTILAIFFVAFLYGEIEPSVIKSEEELYAEEFLSNDESNSTITRLVKEYGEQFDGNYAVILNSNSAEWDKAMLDNAYSAVLYAHKIGAFNQVNNILFVINSAKLNGLNIDDNSYGINQEIRDTMSKRAGELSGKNNESGGNQN